MRSGADRTESSEGDSPEAAREAGAEQGGVDWGYLLDDLFEGIVEPAALERALRRAMAFLNACGVNLHIVSKDSLETLFFAGFGEEFSDEKIAEYLDHWQYVNVHRDAMRRLYNEDPHAVYLCHEHFSEEDWARGPYFQEILAPLDWRWAAGGIAWSGKYTEIAISFARRTAAGQFGENERRFLKALLPNVRRAGRLGVLLAAPERSAGLAGFGAGLASARIPSFLVDEGQRVRWMNEAAESLLADSELLTVADGTLKIFAVGDDRKFRKSIANAANRNLATMPSRLLRFSHRDGAAELEILPATVPTGALIGANALALVMVRAIGLNPAVSENLKARYGLTDAECRLAVSLADGASLEEIASDGGVSQHTVRAQLRSIFSKTGVNRQPALAALVWKSA